MVKVGDTVKWDAGKQGMLSGKVTGGEKGKRWKIEKGGKRYYVEKDKVKKGVVKKPKPAPKKEEPKKKTGQENLQALLGLGDLSSMIENEKKKINEKRKEKLEDVYFGDLEEATTRAHKEQYGVGLKHHPDTSKNTLIKFIFKKGLNVEKHIKDIDREYKERQEKRKKEVEENNAKIEKQARDGKLTYKNFEDGMFDDEKTFDYIRDFEREMEEVQGYNMDYWYSRVTKKDISSWDDLTVKQQERLQEIMMKDIEKQTGKKMKSFYDKFVKGKKFKSIKEIRDLLKKEYDEVTYKH